MNRVIHLMDYSLGAMQVSSSQYYTGPALTLSTEVTDRALVFDAFISKDALGPREMGLHQGTKPGMRDALVAKHRSKIQDIAIRHIQETAGAGIHTSLSSTGVNLLRMM